MGLLQGLLGHFDHVFEFKDVLSEVVNLCLELVQGGTVMSSVLLGALFIRDSVMIRCCKGTPLLNFLFSISRIPSPDSINTDPWISMDPEHGSGLFPGYFRVFTHGNYRQIHINPL